jgi:hypothetical protein
LTPEQPGPDIPALDAPKPTTPKPDPDIEPRPDSGEPDTDGTPMASHDRYHPENGENFRCSFLSWKDDSNKWYVVVSNVDFPVPVGYGGRRGGEFEKIKGIVTFGDDDEPNDDFTLGEPESPMK